MLYHLLIKQAMSPLAQVAPTISMQHLNSVLSEVQDCSLSLFVQHARSRHPNPFLHSLLRSTLALLEQIMCYTDTPTILRLLVVLSGSYLNLLLLRRTMLVNLDAFPVFCSFMSR